MRSEKEQMTAGKDTNTVELQLRDIPGEQEPTLGSAKLKEEKKEVFSKVRGSLEAGRRVAAVFPLGAWRSNMVELWKEVVSVQHRGQRLPGGGGADDLGRLPDSSLSKTMSSNVS